MIIRRLVTSGRHHFFVATVNANPRILFASIRPFFAQHEPDLSHGISGNRNGSVACALKAHLECLLAPLDGALEIHGKMKRLGLWSSRVSDRVRNESECIEKETCGT
jgi:hypothetical protein